MSHAPFTTGTLLWQLSLRWQRAVNRALRPLGLTHAQFVMLARLADLCACEPCVTQRRLAADTGSDPMTVSTLVRTMERRGWITRAVHPDDARARILALTEPGRACLDEATRSVVALDDHCFATTLGERRRQLDAWLVELLDAPPVPDGS